MMRTIDFMNNTHSTRPIMVRMIPIAECFYKERNNPPFKDTLFGPIAPRVYHHYDDYKAMIALYFKFGFCDDNQKIISSGSNASDNKNITLYTGA